VELVEANPELGWADAAMVTVVFDPTEYVSCALTYDHVCTSATLIVPGFGPATRDLIGWHGTTIACVCPESVLADPSVGRVSVTGCSTLSLSSSHAPESS
jgi:hypothetical protein